MTAVNGPLESAQLVYNDPYAKQTQVDTAANNLSAAIAKLIPVTQLNATKLYESVVAEQQRNLSSSRYSPASWAAYSEAKTDAEDYIASLFDSTGEATAENIAANQSIADGYADALTAAYESLDILTDAENARIAYHSIGNLANRIFTPSRLNENDYTAESWTAFTAAREEALTFYNAHSEPGSSVTIEGEGTYIMVGQNESRIYVDAYRAFWDACYEGLIPANAGTATLSVEDVYGLTGEVPASDLFGGTYQVDIPVGGIKLGALLKSKLGNDYENVMSARSIDYALGIFLNGIYLFNMDQNNADSTYVGSLAFEDVVIKPGDEILVSRMRVPMSTNLSGGGTVERAAELVGDIRYLTSSGEKMVELTIEANTGKAFSLNTQYMLSMVNGYTGSKMAQIGAKVYVSDCFASEAEALAAAVSNSANVVTDANGSFSLTLFSAQGKTEGWYVMNLIDTGEKGGVVCGMNVLIHVTDLSDLSELQEDLLEQLEEVYTAYGNDFYTLEQLAAIKDYYDTAKAVLEDNTASSGDLNAAYQTAYTGITEIQQTNAQQADLKLSYISQLLELLPKSTALQAGKLYASDKIYLDALFGEEGIYSGMTEYQKSLLSANEVSRLQTLQTAYEASNAGADLPETPNVVITVEVYDAESDQLLDTGFDVWSYKYTVYKSIRLNNGRVIIIDMQSEDVENGASIPAGSQFEVGGILNDYATQRVETSFSDEDTESWNIYTRFGVNETASPGFLVNNASIRESGTIKVYVKRTSADLSGEWTAQLDEAYAGYSRKDYSDENWTTLYQAYQDGVSAIKAASTDEARQTALNEAKDAMAAVQKKAQDPNAIPNWGECDPFNAGKKVGTVTVTVENNTFPGGAFTGTFISLPGYAIGENDTMMTVILRALYEAGYTWNGTVGDVGSHVNAGDFTISYLATIHKDDLTLGEFSGDPGSGWMGALNDFMVNEGFPGFSVANGMLGDGDVISVMFTQNLGVDLGGSWGNSDTTLRSLDVSGGSLLPSFTPGEAGGSYDFTLVIPGSSAGLVITPHATNINYMVKTFLNEKVTSNAVGNSYYRRTETITVRSGDVIYVGCGERAWPSMNKQGAEARGYNGTWYALHVISSSDGAAYVNELISKLPAGKKITYSNYQNVLEQIAVIDQIKAALNASEQAKVNSASLESARERANSFKAVDAVKQKLAALPKSSSASDSDVLAAKSAIEAADAAYKALTDEQQGYITVGDVANYNELVERLTELTPNTTAETITGSDKMPEAVEDNEITVEPEVKDGEAKAEISADSVTDALKDANPGETLTVKVDTENADSVELAIPADAVQAAADAGVGLNVETENGTAKLDAATVKAAAAAGKDIEVTVKENANGTTTFAVTEDGKAVNIEMKVELPATEAGQVLVIVKPDGTEEVIKKSIVEDGTTYAEIPAGATVKVVENSKSFPDVAENAWYAEAVEFASSHELFEGTNKGFEPTAPMTRAMLATVLYRLEDAVATGTNIFEDVANGTWYTEAAIWTGSTGIIEGTDKGFEPDKNITREQIATILYRYANVIGLDTSTRKSLSSFPDGGDTATWAKDAMEWAVSVGLFEGDETGLNPQGFATRAQVATILMRMVGLIVK